MGRFVEHYNSVRPHSAIGYIAPADFVAGRRPVIWTERDRRLEVTPFTPNQYRIGSVRSVRNVRTVRIRTAIVRNGTHQ